ncbi:hypothetical protein J2W28_001041 [Variovorax boronicumulans]|uniref:hypothetical protein n=1 Tax=Variovorax boronicumulans TaxID=436515 RepID=UPI00278A9667|nr:hypothetical protein [Variovorax boronicumulans]MDP9992013.1 hypothetical protein [Variovorax boronicumulans]MDQ0001908.1 hypothetical protein [Variovorax boronicumulans]
MTARRTPTQRVVDFAIGVIACFVLLVLMAWMDHKQSETDAMRLTAQVDNDRATEHAAMRGPR